MNRKRKGFSLNIQLSFSVILGIILALLMYFLVCNLGTYVIEVKFLNDKAVEKHIGAAYESLEDYIEKYEVEGGDNEKLSRWLKKHNYTYLYVYDNFSSCFEAGWTTEPDENTDTPNEGETEKGESEGPRIEPENFSQDVKNRIVNFADQPYYVFIDTYAEQAWQRVLNILTIVVCFLTLLTSVLVYNAILLKRIKNFSLEVQKIADGCLNEEIKVKYEDEIGMLAVNVENMKNSIIRKHEDERMAWEANAQLITAMSHDIRSPLTSIIGYLDIIEDKKYSDEEERNKFVEACRSKAFQLKELSDKLFQYFLVFGNRNGQMDLVEYDGSLLFQQLLGEHSAELSSYGYPIEMEYSLEDCTVMVDISSVRRLFDNVFSNLRKYADPEVPIRIEVRDREDWVKIEISNGIPKVCGKVESTRIGLKTCERICENMKGKFCYREVEDRFITEIEFPQKKKEKCRSSK